MHKKAKKQTKHYKNEKKLNIIKKSYTKNIKNYILLSFDF